MPDRVPKEPVTLRLRPDGHWVPNTPGRWLYRTLTHVEGVSDPIEYEVFEKHGSLMLRRPGSVDYYDAVMAYRGRGTWEWVTPGTASPVALPSCDAGCGSRKATSE